jgi:hypothetical protein
MSNRRFHGKFIDRKLPRPAVVIIMASLFLLCGQAHSAPPITAHNADWKRSEVKIIARGSSVAGSTGKMDSYLALISDGRDHEKIPARLVHYYASFQIGITDERIKSSRALRLRLTAASYCGIETRDFLVKQVFDAGAVQELQGLLPCYLVRE